MTADKPQPAEQHLEKQSPKGDKPPAGTPITNKDDNRIQQLQERREALATARLTQDPNKGLKIDMGDGRVVEDARGFKGKAQEQAYKNAGFGNPDQPVGQSKQPAEQTRDTDYKPQKTGDHSFALGVNRQESPDTRTPVEKLQDFMQAAARKAADPEGWKAWAQSEINKFAGIGSGLNEAKDETKAAVAAGWKAMTDGTVIEFLSQPNAINAPVFKTVANAFEAMSKDPEAVNKAFEKLGKVVMKASEGYSNLPDYEKGKVIGKVMFGMINPEGDIKDAEAALKIGDTIATHVDKAVWDTAAQAMKAAQEAAKTAPELAQQTKQMLLDYLTSKGLSGPELEYAGVPKGYFDGMRPSEAAKENYLAMSKADESEGLPRRTEGGKESMPEKIAPSEAFVSELKRVRETLSEAENQFLTKHGIDVRPVRRLEDIKPGIDPQTAGIYDPSENAIYIPEEVMSKGQWRQNPDVMFEIRHEFGHALNAKSHPFGEAISDTKDFIQAFNGDFKKMSPQLKDTLRLSENFKDIRMARDEVFADLWAHSTGLLSNNPYSQLMKEQFPHVLQFFLERQ